MRWWVLRLLALVVVVVVVLPVCWLWAWLEQMSPSDGLTGDRWFGQMLVLTPIVLFVVLTLEFIVAAWRRR